MPAIELADALIAWTPGNQGFEDDATCAPPGSIVVVQGPDDRNALNRFPCREGAGDRDWDESDDGYRLQLLADLVDQLVNAEEVRAAHVSEALRAIEGIERLRGYRARSLHQRWIDERARWPERDDCGLSDDEIRALSPRELLDIMIDRAVREAGGE